MKIKQYDCNDAHKTLGNYMSPSFNLKEEYDKLLKTSEIYARSLTTSSLSKYDSWIAYFTVYLPRMTYILPVSFHQHKKLDKIQQMAAAATLQKIGFKKTTPKVVRYGSISRGGLGLRILFIEQGIAQILMITRQLRSTSDLGKLTKITLKWWQQQAGISHPLLEYPTIKLPYLQWNWFTSLRKFLEHISGNLNITFIGESIPPLLRKNDTPIMEEIINTTQNKNMLIKFNRVRLYLGIYSLAEIATADVLEIDRGVWTGERKRFTNQLWPYQERPDSKCFQIWRRLLATTFLRGHRTRVVYNTKNLSLENPLGSWLAESSWIQKMGILL